ncbi:IclR family transcriptional regulator [Bordetella sp. 02P26C-1]|uniref:IclR family transcriptional regulator n=1 Tax=Bordetella sp. 02P26C-1 TaxID=2683195 RepID=UPI001365C075|nr:IclR family transcriptional regulator [Bordetella sp. 02P26C-1]
MPTPELEPRTDDTTRSPLRTLQILSALAANPSPVSLADLSTGLALPKTSLFRLMKTLESGSYVQLGPGGYVLGTESLKLGAALIQNRKFPNCAIPVMQSVSDRCGETIILGVAAQGAEEVLYAEVIEATRPLRFICTVGSTHPLYGSATGQILLSYMPEERLQHYLDHVQLKKHAPGTVESIDALREKLEHIRLTGFSESLEGLVEGVFSVASPIFDRSGVVVAGLSISAPSSRALRQRKELAALALQAGEEISRVLGYAGAYPLICEASR